MDHHSVLSECARYSHLAQLAKRDAVRAAAYAAETDRYSSYRTDAAERYRFNAEELRAIAPTILDSRFRRQLLAIATEYEGMAEELGRYE